MHKKVTRDLGNKYNIYIYVCIDPMLWIKEAKHMAMNYT